MKTDIDILGQSFEVDYEFAILTHGRPEMGPTWYSGGEPAEAAEFEVRDISISVSHPHASLPAPDWLQTLIREHLENRDDINEIVQQADREGDF
jgi:hypothetical protein